MQKISSEFLQGQIIALTYVIDTLLKHHPLNSPAHTEIEVHLDDLSTSMLEKGAKESADGVERIRMALLSGMATSN